MASTYPHPTSSNRLILDPTARGTIVQYALAIEAPLNIAFGVYLSLYPESSLKYIVADPALITPLSTSLAQVLGALIVSLSIPMLFCIPNTRRGIEMRAPLFYYIGGAEVFLIGLFAYLAFGKTEQEMGLSKEALVGAIKNFAPPLAFRLFVLWVKPAWMGRYADSGLKGE